MAVSGLKPSYSCPMPLQPVDRLLSLRIHAAPCVFGSLWLRSEVDALQRPKVRGEASRLNLLGEHSLRPRNRFLFLHSCSLAAEGYLHYLPIQ